MGDKPDFTNCCGTTTNKRVNLDYVQTLESYLSLLQKYVEEEKKAHIPVTIRMANAFIKENQ